MWCSLFIVHCSFMAQSYPIVYIVLFSPIDHNLPRQSMHRVMVFSCTFWLIWFYFIFSHEKRNDENYLLIIIELDSLPRKLCVNWMANRLIWTYIGEILPPKLHANWKCDSWLKSTIQQFSAKHKIQKKGGKKRRRKIVSNSFVIWNLGHESTLNFEIFMHRRYLNMQNIGRQKKIDFKSSPAKGKSDILMW